MYKQMLAITAGRHATGDGAISITPLSQIQNTQNSKEIPNYQKELNVSTIFILFQFVLIFFRKSLTLGILALVLIHLLVILLSLLLPELHLSVSSLPPQVCLRSVLLSAEAGFQVLLQLLMLLKP